MNKQTVVASPLAASPLAISPLDGRYHKYTQPLSKYFSEFALFRYRTRIEIEYFIQLHSITQHDPLDKTICSKLRQIYQNFSLENYETIKTYEKTTNHDVKAVEYFLRDEFKHLGLNNKTHLIHFALTSQDINNTAVPLSVYEYINMLFLPKIQQVYQSLESLAEKWKNHVMIGRTHGQPAVPTTMGKEFKVFSYRLMKQLAQLTKLKLFAKFGGATGNFNAHVYAYPDLTDWRLFADKFVKSLGLNRSQFTTQIDNYDSISELFDLVKRQNVILIDLCRDIWLYISQEYLIQRKIKGEIGSSTMPHKVNPINFENAEGNLGLANCLLEFCSRELPISRLQRDLCDSTISRNFGSIFGYIHIALDNILKGLDKLSVNSKQLDMDLKKHQIVVTEGLQTKMRKEGQENGYELIKSKIDDGSIGEMLDTLDPKEYIGYANDFYTINKN